MAYVKSQSKNLIDVIFPKELKSDVCNNNDAVADDDWIIGVWGQSSLAAVIPLWEAHWN